MAPIKSMSSSLDQIPNQLHLVLIGPRPSKQSTHQLSVTDQTLLGSELDLGSQGAGVLGPRRQHPRLIGQTPVALPQDERRRLRLALPREDPLLIPHHPGNPLCRHEVCEVPDEFPDHVLFPLLIEDAVVAPQDGVLVLLREHDRRIAVKSCHGVRPVLALDDGLLVLSVPVLKLGVELDGDDLGVTGVVVPGEVTVDADHVHVWSPFVSGVVTVSDEGDGSGSVQVFGVFD